MNTLVSVMTSLSEAKQHKEAAKDLWLKAMEQGDENVATLKQAFLAADDNWTAGRETLSRAIKDLQGIFCFDLALSQLDREQRQTLSRLVIELQLEDLTDPFARPDLPTLCRTWYKAEGMREAAKTMQQRFAGRAEDETIEMILADEDRARKPQAWTATVRVYGLIREAIISRGTDESGDALTSTVLHSLYRHLLKHYDDLTEKLADRLEDLYYADALSALLEELDDDLRRVIQDAVGSGLIRQRQPQAEEQTESRDITVALATLEEQLEEDGEVNPDAESEDEDIDPDGESEDEQ